VARITDIPAISVMAVLRVTTSTILLGHNDTGGFFDHQDARSNLSADQNRTVSLPLLKDAEFQWIHVLQVKYIGRLEALQGCLV